ncbi:uncharacterized protein PAC_03165 [Phialocephala subalpina]|uniref:DUF2293 domain-containing protein n=1 Tax=Phialocephala subalpina TaxID=576137 RepID=A0A1L7WKI4_9HELO|nr:uncharacterized protein PAC_03165 [Phialocephala subalpina]
MAKKKKVQAGMGQATASKKGGRTTRTTKDGRPLTKDERRIRKLERRKKEKRNYTADDWAAPAPSHLVAKLDLPKVKSKYQSYFEFADNPERKEKKLEFTVTDDQNPPPGFTFVPIGDPIMTNKCKELSRERDAMIFIVSMWKEENSKISEHIHRTGYHFREMIVEEARDIIGETVISKPAARPGFIEPIPESQDEINREADGAIRDLFPRIPNTDRTMIIEHAFKKGAMFHGEPTVGLQTNIPLSRRVQLAVLAHIRHTHTRYDKLLRETSWMNARKAVEPVCLDVLVKWRGDEETGRDQMDEILREVVIITDSENESDSSEDDDSSDEEGEVTSASSPEAPSLPVSRNEQRPMPPSIQPIPSAGPRTSRVPGRNNNGAISSRTRSKVNPNPQKKAQRGFKRYQAAWEDAVHRRQERPASGPNLASTPFEDPAVRRTQNPVASPVYSMPQHPSHQSAVARPSNLAHQYGRDDIQYMQPMNAARPAYYSQQGPVQGFTREEVTVRSHTDRPVYYQEVPQRLGTPTRIIREQRPSQVVRGSPLKRGPEDMPLPSIETASSDIATPHKDERLSAHENSSHSQDFYPRRVMEQRLQSPAARSVIVINDDTPPIKRRRVVYEDDFGSSRPVQSRDHVYVSAPHSDSHLISAPSAQSEDFLVRRPAASSYSAQGLMRREPEYYTDPVTGERLPIYDAPESSHFASQSEHTRRVDAEPAYGRKGEDRSERPTEYPQPVRDYNVFGPSTRNLTNMNGHEGFQKVERDIRQAQPGYNHGVCPMGPSSPQYPVSQHISRSRHGVPVSNGPDQDFIHSFSQSRLDGPSSQARGGFNVVSEGSYQNGVDYGNFQPYGNYPARSVAPPTIARARSPTRYVERPMQYSQPQYDHDRPVPDYRHPVGEPVRAIHQQHALPQGGAPYFRPTDARQPVYIID